MLFIYLIYFKLILKIQSIDIDKKFIKNISFWNNKKKQIINQEYLYELNKKNIVLKLYIHSKLVLKLINRFNLIKSI